MQAITCFQQALCFWTPETAPLNYATTQNNLGNAYADLPTGEREANLMQAIACFQQALRFQTPEAAPSDCRKTNRNLADLYFKQQDWDSALAAYQAAMDAGECLYRTGLSTESKATEVAENAHLYRHATFAAAHLGNAAEARLILERGKTRLLTEILSCNNRVFGQTLNSIKQGLLSGNQPDQSGIIITVGRFELDRVFTAVEER